MNLDFRQLLVSSHPGDSNTRQFSDYDGSKLVGILFLDNSDRSKQVQSTVMNFLNVVKPNLKEMVVIVIPVSFDVDLSLWCDSKCLFVVAGDPQIQNIVSAHCINEAIFLITTSDGFLIDRTGLDTIMKSPYRAMPYWIELAKKPEKLEETTNHQRMPFKKNRQPFRNYKSARTQNPFRDINANDAQRDTRRGPVPKAYEKFLKMQERADGGVFTDDDESVFSESVASLHVASESDVDEVHNGFETEISTSQEASVCSAEERKDDLSGINLCEDSTASKKSISSIFDRTDLLNDRRSVFDRHNEQNNWVSHGEAQNFSNTQSSRTSSMHEEQLIGDATNSCDHLDLWNAFIRSVKDLIDFGGEEIDIVTEAISAQWNKIPFYLSDEHYRELADTLISKAINSDNVLLICSKLIIGKRSMDISKIQGEMLESALEVSMREKLTETYDARIVSLIETFHGLGHLPDHRLLLLINTAFANVALQPLEALLTCIRLIESCGYRLEKSGGPDGYATSCITDHLAYAKKFLEEIPDTENYRMHLSELCLYRDNGWEKTTTNFGGEQSDFIIETQFRKIFVQLQFLEIQSPKLKEFATLSSSFDACTAMTFHNIIEILYTMNISDISEFMNCREAGFPAKFYNRTIWLLKMAKDLDLPRINNFVQLATIASVCSTPCHLCVHKYLLAQQYNLDNVKANFRIPLATWKQFAEMQLLRPTKGQISLDQLAEIISNL